MLDISELPPEVRRELVDGRHAREVAALQETHIHQQKLAQQLHSEGLDERRAMEGIGAVKLEITPQAYHYWGQRLGYECWKDPQFLREFERDNPAARVRCHGTKLQVGFTGANVRSRKSYG